MAFSGEGRSITDLVGNLAGDISGLFRTEVQLAKAEASEKLNQIISGLVVLLAGGVLALGALGVLLSAAVSALAALFVEWGMGPTGANSLAALIIGVIVLVIAWMLISRGLNAFKAANLKLDRTASSLSRDAAVVKDTM